MARRWSSPPIPNPPRSNALLPEAPLMAGSTVEMKPCESVWVGDSQGWCEAETQKSGALWGLQCTIFIRKSLPLLILSEEFPINMANLNGIKLFFWRKSLPFDMASMNWSCRTFLGQSDIVSGEWVPIWDPPNFWLEQIISLPAIKDSSMPPFRG